MIYRTCKVCNRDLHVDTFDGNSNVCKSCEGKIEFKLKAIVKHVKSNKKYTIVNTPKDTKVLEYCNEPYYEYVEKSKTSPIWLRCKSEMEDGRFILI